MVHNRTNINKVENIYGHRCLQVYKKKTPFFFFLISLHLCHISTENEERQQQKTVVGNKERKKGAKLRSKNSMEVKNRI